MFSNILQQFYNTADSLIIGRFLGGNAFASTGISLIQTPDVLMDYCRIYMTIILIGLPATFLYNFFAAILRSVGNTKAALCFLLISVSANLIFDYLLIAIVKTGISGAAYATVISQLLSALCCLYGYYAD